MERIENGGGQLEATTDVEIVQPMAATSPAPLHNAQIPNAMVATTPAAAATDKTDKTTPKPSTAVRSSSMENLEEDSTRTSSTIDEASSAQATATDAQATAAPPSVPHTTPTQARTAATHPAQEESLGTPTAAAELTSTAQRQPSTNDKKSATPAVAKSMLPANSGTKASQNVEKIVTRGATKNSTIGVETKDKEGLRQPPRV